MKTCFLIWKNHTPTKYVDTFYNKFNDKTGKFEKWRHREYMPNPNGSRQGYLDSLILSRIEAVVHVTAHELRHLWQTNHPGKRAEVWGARGRISNRDADAYAIRKTREWRKLNCAKTDALELSTLLWNAGKIV
jgi:hypothetical protein